ncbi:hypothetical protein HNQ77_003674 [Silvibacterium bohemicum]|uniref:Putative membrane protein insertion efficiency factor n=1 Tax=Silvibacterium bohemicum TaxID=1577686 RepID=A0A841JWD2_9BACT|nr:membrane protein insertion efficiency factor YidD [Silvibacterium bohemicum]MBB6145713.1 hypothetical protein [Silvibacterium bohemicum]
MSLRDRSISFVFGAYKLVVSPLLHALSGQSGACRFRPTCSEYAATAVSQHGFLRGGWLALRRLARCHPFGQGGFDPVPNTLCRHREESDDSLSHAGAPTSTPRPAH